VSADFYALFEFRAIPARDIKSGDLIANHATVTRVVHGPKTEKQFPDKWLRPEKGETTYKCGPGFGSKGRSDRYVVVGRRQWDATA